MVLSSQRYLLRVRILAIHSPLRTAAGAQYQVSHTTCHDRVTWNEIKKAGFEQCFETRPSVRSHNVWSRKVLPQNVLELIRKLMQDVPVLVLDAGKVLVDNEADHHRQTRIGIDSCMAHLSTDNVFKGH